MSTPRVSPLSRKVVVRAENGAIRSDQVSSPTVVSLFQQIFHGERQIMIAISIIALTVLHSNVAGING